MTKIPNNKILQGSPMKKHFYTTMIISSLLLGNTLYADGEKAVLSNSKVLGYAYMQGGTKLLKVSTDIQEHDKDVELIRITEGGFFMDYDLNPEQIDGRHIPCLTNNGNAPRYLNHGQDLTKACQSHYLVRTAGDIAGSVVGGVVYTTLNLGINLFSGEVPDEKTFDKEQLLKIIDENNLGKYRVELLTIKTKEREITNYAKQKSQEMDALYAAAYNAYADNQKTISISYTVNDKSGLLQDKNLNGDYSVALHAPAKKNYDYAPFLKTEIPAIENTLAQLSNVKEKIDQQYQKDIKEYKKYLSAGFKDYTIAGTSERTFTHNGNISFFATLKAPTTVPYTLGKKTHITIPITVEYANLEKMVPKEYLLSDSNFAGVMKASSYLTINGALSNKTQSFLTVKSLTCYYQNLVNNLSNLDKELAPESKDLDDGTQYGLLSSTMQEKSNFTKMTKSKIESIKINYGYAVKYRINDTNIEKAIYTTKNYSLYDIFRQYL